MIVAEQSYFADLKSILAATGLTQAMASSAADVSARKWAVKDEEFPDYRAARLFGTEAALEDGYLPGACCLAALAALDRGSAEAAMTTVAADILELSRLLADNPWLVEGDRYSANDGRTEAFPPTVSADGYKLTLEDQDNTFHIAVRHGDASEIRIVSKRRIGRTRRKCLDLSFKADADGHFAMTGAIGQGADAIRSWNSLVSTSETLAVCAREAVAERKPANGPFI